MKLFRNLAVGAAALFGAMTMASTASADVFFLTLTDAQSALPAPYGQVEVTQGGAGVLNFAVTLFDGLKFTDTGAHFAFSFSLAGAPAIALSGAPAGFSLVSNTDGIANSPFGAFDYGLACSVCDPNTGGFTGPLNFTITGAGLTLASLATATGTFDGQSVLFAADTIALTGATGTVGGGIGTAVPEPATWAMMILGFGMVGAGLRMRRRLPNGLAV